MQLVLEIIGGLLILVFLVVVHELGHAIVARRNAVVVEEFGIGFPPRAWSKKLKNGVVFSLNWLPLGGFVRMQGENDAADKKGDYGAASFGKKTRILLAGVLINWLVAAILLTILAITGLPKIVDNQFSVPSDTKIIGKPVELTAMSNGYPAQKAGLQSGDEILGLAGTTVTTPEQFVTLTQANKGKTVPVVYERNGTKKTVNLTLLSNKTGPVFGAALGQRQVIRATWSAPIVGVVETGQFTWLTLQGIGTIISNLANGLISELSPSAAVRHTGSAQLGAVGDSVSGPIGILGTIFPQAEQAGPTQLVFLTAIISLSLAVMNVLPIPALDGGRWYTMALFKLFKKRLTKEREEKIQAVGFFILMGLIVLITIGDVTKLFK
jgi:regulator of sigma E protease